MNYHEAIDYLERLRVFGIKAGLERISRLLARLDNPQSKYKTIHVTGTNGKGSVCAMLNQILSTAGFKVGMFTSPHLTSYCERFRLNGREIDEESFAAGVERIAHVIDAMLNDGDEHPTQFEAMTAMAFDYFARENVDYAVIEVGLGGTLDSTNVITPVVSVITNVGMDHADKCGGTLENIARHKAGIIKRGVPVVTAAKGEPLKIISAVATLLDAKLIMPPTVDVKTSLEGDYQRENVAVAVAAAECLNEPRITRSIIESALEHVKWAGRFELFDVNGRTVVIDGAHNPDGATALRRSLDIKFGDRPRRFLFGVLGDKDFNGMINILFRPSDEVIVTRPQSDRAADPNAVAKLIERRQIRAEAIDDVKAAFDKWINGGTNQTVLIAAGSLYMIGGVRQMLVN
ncbi:MAG: bifunctional folylpolyglutamate synthase/dihydrofolate synthase [Selenomonadaceae bacterium]|nr:bifunctional folylpolyglutamate synthase/dihydrofolate synthase [Selenomonadaceae bacterium]